MLKELEGLRLGAYYCSSNKLTIGYGHTGQDVYKGTVITEKWAEEFLIKDLRIAENELLSYDLDLNNNQYNALLSFIFNIGIYAFRESSLLKELKENPNSEKIGHKLGQWIYADKKVVKGLKLRREREIELYYR